MCLYTNQEKPKTATEPIRCMKVVRKNVEGQFLPLVYRGYGNSISYTIGEETSILPFERESFATPLPIEAETIITKEGFQVDRGLHTYTMWNISILCLAKRWTKSTYVILECEIPVGALYYEGHTNTLYSPLSPLMTDETGFVSDKLRVVREVPLLELEDILGNKTGGEKCV